MSAEPTIRRDLERGDFPLTIVVWRPGVGEWRNGINEGAPAEWVWAVTVLPPAPGTRTPLYVPSFADVAPVWVTTVTAADNGQSQTTGPYDPPDV